MVKSGLADITDVPEDILMLLESVGDPCSKQTAQIVAALLGASSIVWQLAISMLPLMVLQLQLGLSDLATMLLQKHHSAVGCLFWQRLPS